MTTKRTQGLTLFERIQAFRPKREILLICNRNARGGYDVLTNSQTICAYAMHTALCHEGKVLGPADMYDEGLFGCRPAHEIEICTQGLLTDDEIELIQMWRNACAIAKEEGRS